jgi:hypothetical protein
MTVISGSRIASVAIYCPQESLKVNLEACEYLIVAEMLNAFVFAPECQVILRNDMLPVSEGRYKLLFVQRIRS